MQMDSFILYALVYIYLYCSRGHKILFVAQKAFEVLLNLKYFTREILNLRFRYERKLYIKVCMY